MRAGHGPSKAKSSTYYGKIRGASAITFWRKSSSEMIPQKLLSMRGDFATDVALNDYVYVVGYITGTSRHRLGPSGLKYSGKVPDLSVRALLKPSEARELLARNATN
jgi:hypothetical protein